MTSAQALFWQSPKYFPSPPCGRRWPRSGRMSNCVRSWVLRVPFLAGSQQGEDDAEHAPSDGDDSGLFGDAGGDEAIAVGLHDRVAADGGERGHVGDVSDFGSSAGDPALAGSVTAVVVEGGETDEGGPLAS